MPSDLLGVLVRRTAAPGEQREDAFGVIALATIAKGLVTGIRRGSGWLKSPQGQKHLAKLKVSTASKKARIALYEKKVATATKPKTKARWEARLARTRKQYADMRLDERLAEQGIVDEGPVLEVKRNLVASEWESADAKRKAEIEKLIAKMDSRIARLQKEKELVAIQHGSGARREPVREVPIQVLGSLARRQLIPSRGGRFEKGVYGMDTQLVQGVGGLTFRRFAPPGPGRLFQVPFYPQAADSWIGANGIEEVGDDPVLCARVPVGARTAGPYLLTSRAMSWARYRIVGVQTQDQPIVQSGAPDAAGAFPPVTTLWPAGFTLSALRVHNDRNVFVQEDEVAAWDFSILPPEYEWNSAKGAFTVNTLDSANRYRAGLAFNTKYAGLRDYPVLGSNSTASIMVSLFASEINAAAADLQVPFTVNLLVEVLEDELLGDPVAPSPAARAGAVVKLGGHEIEPGHYEVQSAGYTPRGR